MTTPTPPRLALIGLAMLILVVSKLAALYLPFELFNVVAIGSLVVIFCVAWQHLKLREVYSSASAERWLRWLLDLGRRRRMDE